MQPQRIDLTGPAKDWKHRALLYGGYSLSGFSALIYQVAWQRILAIHSGVGIYSVALIVSAFMAGLGIGSLAGARMVQSKHPTAALLLFVICEVFIGGFGLISCIVYYQWIGAHSGILFSSVWGSGVVHFLALLLPTMLMGMSLPFLSQYVATTARDAPKSIGSLYAANIFGAAFGALITPWILIRFLGLENAVQIAAVANLLAGLIGFVLWKSWETNHEAPRAKKRSVVPATIERVYESKNEVRLHFWILLYGISGAFSLALEVLWFRVVEVSVRSTAFTFGTVLCIYLLGLGLGCVIGASVSNRVRSPFRAFLLCQSLLITYAGVTIWLIVRLPTSVPLYRDLVDYWNSTVVFGLSEDWNVYRVLLLYVFLPVFLYGIPTVLMGISFGLLQRGVQLEPNLVGERIGILQAANILGNVFGSLVAGLLLIHYFGTPMAFRILLLGGLCFPLLSIVWFGDKRQWAFVLLLIALTFSWPSKNDFWGRFHGVIEGKSYFAEDASGLMAITPSDSGKDDYRVSMNGKLQSWIPFGGAHTELGVLAATLHPNPQDTAIIGLGSGDTAWAAGCRSETKTIHVFEICAAEKRLLKELAPQFSEVHRLMNDARVSIFDEDGRKALTLSTTKYDVIEADALPPQCAYAGNIYSVEFFRLCASRLKPNGLMCQWAPTLRTMRTFSEVFRYVVVSPTNSIVIGSNDPIEIDFDVLRSRLAASETSNYLGPKNRRDLEIRIMELRPLKLEDDEYSSINTDLFPMDEFRSP